MVSIDKIMKYEDGQMERDGEEEVAMFQEMIDDRSVWHLQGSYGRVAVRLLEQGLCVIRVKEVSK